MRVVIEEIQGDDLAKLYVFLRTIEFGNKTELFKSMNKWAKQKNQRVENTSNGPSYLRYEVLSYEIFRRL